MSSYASYATLRRTFAPLMSIEQEHLGELDETLAIGDHLAASYGTEYGKAYIQCVLGAYDLRAQHRSGQPLSHNASYLTPAVHHLLCNVIGKQRVLDIADYIERLTNRAHWDQETCAAYFATELTYAIYADRHHVVDYAKAV